MELTKVVVLGTTGSIGTSACNCIRRFRDRFSLVGVSANNNIAGLKGVITEFHPLAVCAGTRQGAEALKQAIPGAVQVFSGEEGLELLVEETDFDILLNALVGAVGLRATVAALKRNKRVALANKESLVIGGEYINALLAKGCGRLIPVDSEHSAILQCLMGEDVANVESIILTASGGPFRERSLDTFGAIRPQDALNHPTWSMGRKITIDAATLINKGFEVIEAHHLFNMPYSRLRVVIHPQSIIHSMVEFHDGAIKAQMGVPDMELPIQFALSYPQRLAMPGRRLDFGEKSLLSFYEPDFARFPCLKLCLDAGATGGTMPAVLNAANEIAVQAFLDGAIRFDRIAALVRAALEEHAVRKVDGLEIIEEVDKKTRMAVERAIRNGVH
jgi:1-deoxy-D-xylulose-5-phosphate reductoisomerase